MRRFLAAVAVMGGWMCMAGGAAELPPSFPADSLSVQERTCFQTGQGLSPNGNLRSDVAIVYGIDPGLPGRIKTWRDRGYRVHVMTGVSWGEYQDYLYGRFDGVNHEDEAQTDRAGKKISHGGDVYYMCPGENFGKFLCVGVQRVLDADVENLVRSTGRSVWYLNDPIEDNPDYDWEDYRVNWESTLVASLLQPDVWQYEVSPWPERVFGGRYPKKLKRDEREPIPPTYATELQTVFNALNDLRQPSNRWDCGTTRLGVVVSDSLMFQRGDPTPSDPHLSHVYGLALPLLKRGMPVAPVQLENLTVSNYLNDVDVLMLSYHGQKPLTPDVHPPLVEWVRAGGVLVVCDDDSDPYNAVREW